MINNYDKYYGAVVGVENKELRELLTKLSYPRFSTRAQTAWVEYDQISKKVGFYFNPTFFEKLSDKELRGVVLHEVLHIIMGHLVDLSQLKPEIESGKINPSLVNIAMDAVINDMIGHMAGQDGHLKLVEGAVTGRQIVGRDCSFLSWKVVYNLIQDNMDNSGGDGSGDNKSQNSGGLGNESPNESSMDDHSMWEWDVVCGDGAKRITEEVQAAAKDFFNKIKDFIEELSKSEGKSCGSNPLGEKRNLLSGSCSFWKDIERMLQKILPVKFLYNWRRRHRAFYTTDVIIPSERISEEDRRLVVYIDASGSIDESMLAEFVDGINRIRRLGLRIFVFSFDTNVYEVKEGDIRGGGGTSFDAVVEHFIHKFPSDYGIVITDGYSSIKYNPPRLYWVVTESTSSLIGVVPEDHYIFSQGTRAN